MTGAGNAERAPSQRPQLRSPSLSRSGHRWAAAPGMWRWSAGTCCVWVHPLQASQNVLGGEHPAGRRERSGVHGEVEKAAPPAQPAPRPDIVPSVASGREMKGRAQKAGWQRLPGPGRRRRTRWPFLCLIWGRRS